MRLLISLFLTLGVLAAEACTSAIVGGRLTSDGRPLMWKNRDTGTLDNFVATVRADEPDKLDFVALFNAGDSLLQEAWIGVNSAGFAVMNTASYNLAPDTASYRDREGEVMRRALQSCRNLADFEHLLEALPRPMGVQANFGAMDADGNAAYYETDDLSYRKYDVADAPEGYIVRTNYSYSGEPDTGFGYIREANALHLLEAPAARGLMTPELFTDTLSCSFYHSLTGRDMLDTDDEWIVDQDFIPRHSTSASVAIGGGDRPVMYVALGYPPCAERTTVTVGSVPADFGPSADTWHSKACDRAMQRKDAIFPIKRGSGPHYINVAALRQALTELRQRKQ